MVIHAIVKGEDETEQRKLGVQRGIWGKNGISCKAAILIRRLKQALLKTFEHKGSEGISCVDVYEEAFQIDKAASAKSLKWKWAYCVQEIR